MIALIATESASGQHEQASCFLPKMTLVKISAYKLLLLAGAIVHLYVPGCTRLPLVGIRKVQ